MRQVRGRPEILMRLGDDVGGDDLSERSGSALAGFDGSFYGGDFGADDYGHVSSADLLLAVECSVRGEVWLQNKARVSSG